MSFLVQLFRATRDMPTPVAQAIDAWRALPAVADETPIGQGRFVVVNVETAGFDARRARLLALGAVLIENTRVVAQEVFVSVLRYAWPAHDDLVEHGVTSGMQRAGEPPQEVLSAFLTFVGKTPCVAFHAAFTQTVLDCALRAELGAQLANPWIDLAPLARTLVPEAQLAGPGLDDWLRHFGLRVLVRDHALHDAQVTAELFAVLLQRATARGLLSLSQLSAAARPSQQVAMGVGLRG